MTAGAGSPAVEVWLASMLPALKSNLSFWTFDYNFSVKDKFTSQNIWTQGEKLLKGNAAGQGVHAVYATKIHFHGAV